MSTVFKNSSLITFFFAMATLSAAATFIPELTAIDIAALCKQSINQTFCLDFMNSTAGILATDLLGAGKITLDAGHDRAKQARKCVTAMLAGTTDPKLKESYKTCLEEYGDAADNISAAKASLVAKDYAAVNVEISAAMTDAGTCNDEVEGLPAAAELGETNQYLANVLDIGLLIANTLAGSHD